MAQELLQMLMLAPQSFANTLRLQRQVLVSGRTHFRLAMGSGNAVPAETLALRMLFAETVPFAKYPCVLS